MLLIHNAYDFVHFCTTDREHWNSWYTEYIRHAYIYVLHTFMGSVCAVVVCSLQFYWPYMVCVTVYVFLTLSDCGLCIFSSLTFYWVYWRRWVWGNEFGTFLAVVDKAVFLPCDAICISVAYTVVLWPFVCLSCSCIVSKRLNVINHPSFPRYKHCCEIPTGTP